MTSGYDDMARHVRDALEEGELHADNSITITPEFYLLLNADFEAWDEADDAKRALTPSGVEGETVPGDEVREAWRALVDNLGSVEMDGYYSGSVHHTDVDHLNALLSASPKQAPVTVGAASGEVERLRKHLRAALDHYERNICHHDSTHRGGTIWTICDDCGARWADDRGGFKPFAYPKEIEEAFAALSAYSPLDGQEKGATSPDAATRAPRPRG